MTPHILIGNKKHGARGEYVGRPSPLGNLFSHLSGTLARYRVGSRDEAVERYRGWLKDRIAEGDPRVMAELRRLARLARERGRLTLVCWCHPLACHAWVIRDALLRLPDAES